jgi:hypothetical protein
MLDRHGQLALRKRTATQWQRSTRISGMNGTALDDRTALEEEKQA